MRKAIALLLIIGVLLAGIPTSAKTLYQDIDFYKTEMNSSEKFGTTPWISDLLFDGNFTGWFGIKNEKENYNILGYVQGYYINRIGFFIGQWNTTDNRLGGYVVGFFVSNFLLGWAQIGLKNSLLLGIGLPFIGYYVFDSTTYEFNAEVLRPVFPNFHICCQCCKFEK